MLHRLLALRWVLLLQSTGSRCLGFSSFDSEALECGDTWASLPRGTWDLPVAGIEPVPPALADRFWLKNWATRGSCEGISEIFFTRMILKYTKVKVILCFFFDTLWVYV